MRTCCAAGRSVPAVNTMHSESFSGDVTVHLTDEIQFKSITAYQKYSGRFTQNANNSPLPVALVDNQASFKQFTQELRLVGTSFSGMLDWALGGFYFWGKSGLGGGAILQASGPADPVTHIPSGIAFDQNEGTNARNRSAFAHGSFHLTDQFTVTAGLRYTNEWKNYMFNRTNIPSGTPFFPGGAFTSPKSKMSRVDYKLGADYKLTDDIMVYAQFSTGFKGGGVNPRPFTPATAVPFGPETLKAYEAGIKTELFDRRVRLNVAAYHSDYTNLQLSANGLDNEGSPSIIIANAGSVDIQGVEVELQIRPTRAFSIDAAASYTDFEFKDLGAAGGVSGGPTLASKPPATPKWKLNGGAQYVIDLGDAGSLTPRFDVYYQSLVFNEYTNNPLAAQPGYAVANGRVTYTSPDESWSAALAVTNIFDKFYYVNKFIQAGSYIFTGQPSRPREWSITVRKQF